MGPSCVGDFSHGCDRTSVRRQQREEGFARAHGRERLQSIVGEKAWPLEEAPCLCLWIGNHSDGREASL